MRDIVALGVVLALTGCASQYSATGVQTSADPTPGASATPPLGITAKSAAWSAYGGYLNNLLHKIQVRWDRILINRRKEPPPGTYVTVKFKLSSSGQVLEILDVKGTSTKEGEAACLGAIGSSGPFGAWTTEMVALLGTSQDITFTFVYK